MIQELHLGSFRVLGFNIQCLKISEFVASVSAMRWISGFGNLAARVDLLNKVAQQCPKPIVL